MEENIEHKGMTKYWMTIVFLTVAVTVFGGIVYNQQHLTIDKALRQHLDPGTSAKRRMEIVTYLRQTGIKKDDKATIRAALEDPRYQAIHNHLQMCLLHGILDFPEESDKNYILGLLENHEPLGWLIYSITKLWDNRYVPYLLAYIKTTPRSPGAIEMIGRMRRDTGAPLTEAIPVLEEALMDGDAAVMNAAHNALYSLTGRRYEYKYFHWGDEKPRLSKSQVVTEREYVYKYRQQDDQVKVH